METNKDNKNIKELTDDQLKQVAGGGSSDCNYSIHACRKMDIYCNCAECEAGWELQWGVLGTKGGTVSDIKICVQQ